MFRVKNKNGLYSNGKMFTKSGKIFTTEGALTNSVVQSKDPFMYMGRDITLETTENMITRETPIESWLYEKLNNYYKEREYGTEIGDKLKQLNILSREIEKDGYEIDDWE